VHASKSPKKESKLKKLLKEEKKKELKMLSKLSTRHSRFTGFVKNTEFGWISDSALLDKFEALPKGKKKFSKRKIPVKDEIAYYSADTQIMLREFLESFRSKCFNCMS